ncbi:MAG: hypothetical protein AB1424_07795 [Thermodesulfobacteriota bacterium]
MSAKRITFTIPEADKEWLDAYCRVHKISVAAAIRQGIDFLKEEQRQKTYQRLLESTRGLWKRGNSLEYQQNIRSEWG